MARCPKLKTEDTGWFSWANYCEVTGIKVGDENHREKVKSLCDPDEGGYRYEDCPIYRNR